MMIDTVNYGQYRVTYDGPVYHVHDTVTGAVAEVPRAEFLAEFRRRDALATAILAGMIRRNAANAA